MIQGIEGLNILALQFDPQVGWMYFWELSCKSLFRDHEVKNLFAGLVYSVVKKLYCICYRYRNKLNIKA